MSATNFVKQLLGLDKIQNDNIYLSKNELPEESVARVLMTGILKNQFYRSADDMAKEAVPLFVERAKKDPEFLLKAACVARNSHMKGMVKVALAAISGSAPESFLKEDLTRRSAVALLQTFHPGQLIQFVEICKSKKLGRGFGSRPQKWVRLAMENWSYNKLEDYTLKYPSALNQLTRLVHPRYTDNRAGLIRYVLDGRKAEATGKKQKVVEQLKTTKDNKYIAQQMLDHHIPWDVIKGFAGLNDEIALAAMTQMGLTALLLNILSLGQKGVFSTLGGLEALKMKLSEVKNNRSIPLDFAKPYSHSTNQNVRDILVDAMADTLDVPMPVIEGLSIGVSVDISGSMSGEPLKTAGLLAVPFIKAKNIWLTTFNTNLYEEGDCFTTSDIAIRHNPFYSYTLPQASPKIKNLPRKQQIHNLLNMQATGGTDVSKPIEAALRNNKFLDLMVLITDEQQNSGTPLMKAWKRYKEMVNPKALLWIINASNYQWHSADFGDMSVTVYQTMTPAIFKNLEYFGQDMTQIIRKFSLEDFCKPKAISEMKQEGQED